MISNDPVPLSLSDDGVVRVGKTRVTLDTVVEAFREGASAEQIAEQYPSLDLGEVYAVIGFVLRHETNVDQYLAERRRRAEHVKAENERRFPASGLREKLMKRRRAQG